MRGDVLRSVAAAALVACFALTACNRKAEQCDKLIGVINDNGKPIRAASAKLTGAADDVKAYEEVASVLDAAADKMSKVELRDEKLRDYAKEYVDMAHSGAQAARDVVEAQKKNDMAALTKAMADIGKVETTEAGLVAKVNGYCTAK